MNLKNALIIFLIIISVITGIYGYINYRMGKAVEHFTETVKESARKRQKRLESGYGQGIKEITQDFYSSARELRELIPQINPSIYSTKEDKIEIVINNQKLLFENYYDNHCMACAIDHELIGEIRELNKVIIITYYFRSSIVQLIDKENGKIDTLEGIPVFSPDYKLMVTQNHQSKDELKEGIKLYAVNQGQILFIRDIGQNWIPEEIIWLNNRVILAKIYPKEKDNVDWDKIMYIRVSRRNTRIDNQSII